MAARWARRGWRSSGRGTALRLLAAVALGLLGCDSETHLAAPAGRGGAGATAAVAAVATTSPGTASAGATASAASTGSAAAPSRVSSLEGLPSWGDKTRFDGTLQEQNALLMKQLVHVHRLSAAQLEAVERIFAGSQYLGQGNPLPTEHPVSMAACLQMLRQKKLLLQYENPAYERICGAKFMAPLYDPSRQQPHEAGACIDQFEFPSIPCTYPVTWVRAREAAELCRAVGKRICDAHEWEGACAGALLPPDYDFKTVRFIPPKPAVTLLGGVHNSRVFKSRRWAYGPEYRKGVCGTGSSKSKTCLTVTWGGCGSNTFPAGYFPECKSPLDVYDQHGNAAEHMNLPLKPEQLASRGSAELGHTEMKGSWFVFDLMRAHSDYCRWRAPYWHGSTVMNENSHRNYHLGFRCCKTVGR